MILITSASYLASEFQAEFGKIVPSFLAFGGKRLYEYQAKLFSDSATNKQNGEKIVLSLPQSFAVSDFEKEKIKDLGIEPLFVPDNLSLGASINYCLNMNLPLNEPLQILHGDTYFMDFAPFVSDDSDALGISKSLYNYEWADLESININDSCDFIADSRDFSDCDAPQTHAQSTKDFILNGYFRISRPYHFIKAMLRANYDFILALKIYSKDFPFSHLKNDSWLDFGLISSYFHSKSVIFTQRHFNKISIDSSGTFIRKTSNKPHKIQAEIAWFESLPKELCLFAPKIHSTKVNSNGKSYKCEYLYLNTLAEIFVFGRLSGYAFKIIFDKCLEFLSKLHSINQLDSTPNFCYREKSMTRLREFAKQRDLDLNAPFRFNGKNAPSLNALIDKLDSFINAEFEPCFIHGDFCFSNIAFDFRALRIKTFDPRGLDFSDKISVYGDKRYDYAKLAHSVLGLYDFIVFGFYKCEFKDYEFRFDIEIGENIRAIQRIFLDLFDFVDKNEILAITCHLFLSMLPLHSDDIKRQNALLANAYRIYFDLLNGGDK